MKLRKSSAVLALIVAAASVCPPCFAGKPQATSVPDLSKIVHLVGTTSLAHACPVSPTLALTARHVVVERRVAIDDAPANYRGSSDAGWQGFLTHEGASKYDDTGILSVKDEFPSFYPIASKAPEPGDQLWWIGFDWRKKKAAFDTRVFTGTVLRVVAGVVILDVETSPGSSGSCVLNSDGEVVAIVSFGSEMEDSNAVAGVVGVWEPWFKLAWLQAASEN